MCSSFGGSLALLMFLLGSGCLNSSSYGQLQTTEDLVGLNNCSRSADFELLPGNLTCSSVNDTNRLQQSCTLSEYSTGNGTIEYNLTSTNTISSIEKEDCLFVACRTKKGGNLSCALYKYNCSSSLCDTATPDDVKCPQDSDSESGGGGAVAGLAVLVALLCVALITAVMAIVTLVLMVRQLQSERGEDKRLPNPYASCMVCFLPSDDQPPKKAGNKKKTAPAKSSHRQTEGKAAAAVRAPPPEEDEEEEGPDHDQDDYEEMGMKQREGSFTEEGDDDIYQNN